MRSTYDRRPSQPIRILVDNIIDSSWHSGSGDTASDEYDYDYEEDEDMDKDGGEDIDTSSDSDLDGEPKPNVSDKRSYLRSN